MKTKIHIFNYDTRKPEELKRWNELKATMRAHGQSPFDAYGHAEDFIKDDKVITLDTQHLFNNQWNTADHEGETGHRVFDFRLYYPRNHFMTGYWLEQSDAMKEIRAKNFHCGYCGKMYYLPDHQFCLSCLGSEYLKEDELYLLRLTPINVDRFSRSAIKGKAIPGDTLKAIPADLLTAYHERQKVARHARLEKRKTDKLVDLQKEREEKEIEFNGMKFLIDLDLDFDNVIYYRHTERFGFGWREKIDSEIAQSLRDKLKEEKFPYPFDIETIGGGKLHSED